MTCRWAWGLQSPVARLIKYTRPASYLGGWLKEGIRGMGLLDGGLSGFVMLAMLVNVYGGRYVPTRFGV